MADLLRIGVSGVTTYQRALQVTGNNITKSNVESYSRQETLFDAGISQFSGAGYLGTGVKSQGVERVVDEFLVSQLRVDTGIFERMDTYLNNISPLDSFLADPSTGLSVGFERFFSALQAGSEDPAFVPVRQLILDESEGLVQRFHTLNDRLVNQQENMNEQIRSMVGEVNSIATGLADINEALSRADGNTTGGDRPNDLLDARDELLRSLSEYLSFDLTVDDQGITTVSLGTGSPIVFANSTTPLVAEPSTSDLRRVDIGFSTSRGLQAVNDQIASGALGGLFAFRNEVLEPSFNELGRIAMVLSEEFNRQHKFGLDLDGSYGGDYFRDINGTDAIAQRVIYHQDNAIPDDREITVTIKDVAALGISDYDIEFKGPTASDFQITRSSDNEIILFTALPGSFPVRYEFDGLEVSFNAGSYQVGDKFKIFPTKNGASNIDLLINRPQEVALAAPVISSASLGNVGGGDVTAGVILDTFDANGLNLLGSFTTSSELTPPTLIRFTSPTTYDVLDNSNPSSPVDLVPPMRNRQFVLGGQNDVFTADPNQTSVSSDTAVVATISAGAFNPYPAETVTVTFLDPDTGVVTTESANLLINATAQEQATALSAMPGVSAIANTSMRMTIADSGGGAPFMGLTLNGEDLTNSVLGTVPDPIDNDFIRDRINSNSVLQAQGISAISNPVTGLTVRSTTGVNLSWQVTGGAVGTDLMSILEVNGQVLGAPAVSTNGDTATIGGTVTVEMANSGRLETNNAAGVFSSPPPIPVNTFRGYQVRLDGTPATGDEFSVNFNSSGVSDNRNALAMLQLASTKTIDNGTVSFVGAYGRLVEFVGSTTSQAMINQEASQTLLRQSADNRASVSGVNLDEEAALLIRFEQAYNASAQLIQVGRTLFDTLIGVI